MISLWTLCFFIGLAIFVLAWQRHTTAREAVLAIVNDLCDKNNWQLLDDSVQYQKMHFHHSKQGGIYLERTFAFEYLVNGSDTRHRAEILYRNNGQYTLDTNKHPVQIRVKTTKSSSSSSHKNDATMSTKPRNTVVQLDQFRKFKSNNDDLPSKK